MAYSCPNQEHKSQHKYVLSQQQLVIPVVSLLLFLLALNGFYIYWTTKALDEKEFSHTCHLAETALNGKLAELGDWTRDYAYWDDAIDHLLTNFNLDWADANIGSYLYETFGVDQSYVVNETDQTIIAFHQGKLQKGFDLKKSFATPILELLQETRRTSMDSPQAATGIVSYDNRIFLIACSVFMPEYSQSGTSRNITRPALILARELTDDLLSTMGHQYLLKELKFASEQTAVGHGELLLINPEGKILGKLHWQLDMPGIKILRKQGPLFILALILVILLTMQLVRRIDLFSQEKNRAEKSLSENRWRLAAILKACHIGLWDYDAVNNICHYDSASAAMAGFTDINAETPLKHLLHHIHHKDRPKVNRALSIIASGDSELFEEEFRLRCRANSYQWMKAEGHVLEYDHNRKPARIIGILTDISRHKEEETLRTEIENRLHQKHKMEALGTMASGIAHDFNNVLSIIFSNVFLAQKTAGATSQVTRNLTQIQKAADRAKDMVSQILAFSRQTKSAYQTIDLAAQVEDSLDLMCALVPASVELNFRIIDDPPPLKIEGDRTQIQQVLMNLCTNGIHAMNEKGTLRITLQKVDSEEQTVLQSLVDRASRYAKLSVCDSGCGMDDETKEKIFNPFFTTKEAGVGSGLGLAIVHGIVERHRGLIHVDSMPGEGTRIDIYLPLTDESSGAAAEAISQLNQRKNEHILLIDDEEDLLSS